MNFKNLTSGALVISGLALAGPALAQAQDNTGFYLGGAVGYANYDVDMGPLFAAGATTASADNSGTGWKLFGGLQFHRNWGVELGYVDLGKVGFNGTVGPVPFAGSVDLTAWTLAAVGTVPLSQNFDLFGKLGMYHWMSKGNAFAGGIGVVTDDNGNDGYGGLGVRYNINRNLGVQAEWEHFAGDDKVDLFSIGLRYKF